MRPRASVAPRACAVTLDAIWIWTWPRRRAGQGGSGAAGRNSMNDEARATGGLDPAPDRAPRQRSRWGRRSPYGYPRHDGAQGGPPAGRPMPRSISAPTIAGCWWRARPATASASSMRSPASSGWAKGVSASGRISDAAIARAVDALGICRDKMRNRGVTRARLIATEACRAAENGAEFRARIAEEVGLELEIIDRETEAELAATGCTPLIDPRRRRRDPVRYRRRLSELVRLEPLGADAGAVRRCRRSRPGSRCRSAW